MTKYKVDFKSIPWTSSANGIREKAFKADHRQLRLVEYSKDMPPHWCKNGHIGYVSDGKMEIRFENTVHTYFSGDGVFILSGQKHKHMADPHRHCYGLIRRRCLSTCQYALPSKPARLESLLPAFRTR